VCYLACEGEAKKKGKPLEGKCTYNKKIYVPGKEPTFFV
jgi:hypothetical protein